MSRSAGKNPTPARTSVLIVGDLACAQQFGKVLHEPVHEVGSIFEAIGELTVARRRPRIGTVVLCNQVIERLGPRAVESLRRADPSVRLVLYHDRGEVDDETRRMVDAVCAGDGDVATIAAAITSQSVCDIPPDTEQPTPNATASDDTPAQTEPAIEAPDPLTDSPGDVDLVEAILERSDRALPIAVEIIRQNTGWTDLRFEDSNGVYESKTPYAFATVEHGAEVFGWLVTLEAEPGDLQPWADWLGAWLALDSSYAAHCRWAMTDELTGAGSRRAFRLFMEETVARARDARQSITLMIFDIDDFKHYNDRYGHDAGDEILREMAQLMMSVIRKGDRVFRIGGDEFAVVFADPEKPREPGSTHPDEIEIITQRFREQTARMRFPKLGPDAQGTLTISGGLATFPWEGGSIDELLKEADRRLLESKRRGKNVITFGGNDRPRGQDVPGR